MSLSVQVGKQRFPATRVAVERAIGRPVAWLCSVPINPDVDKSSDVPDLVAAISRDAASLSAFLDGQPLVQEARVVGARWGHSASGSDNRGRQRNDAPAVLEIQAITTAARTGADIFKPRRRVHRVKTWRELIDRLDSVAVASTGVRNHLDRYSFPSGANTSVIQDGESDWELLANVVTQFSRIESDPALSRFALVGGNTIGDSTERRWVLNWASGAGYEKMQDFERRLVDASNFATHTQFGFDRVRNATVHAREFATGDAPSVRHYWEDRPVAQKNWDDWLDRDPPFFVGRDRSFAWRVVDQLADSGQQSTRWSTELYTAPMAVALETALPKREATPWMGFGIVSDSPKTGQWIEVRLDGFESDEDTVKARVTTTYSGTDNRKGVHLVPETGTPVLVAWSGRLMDPLVVLANVRDAAAAFASPAVWIESTLTSQYADIACKSVGAVSIDSDLEMSIKGAGDMKSGRPMTLSADGCDVALRGGVFYTGKGM